MANKAKGMSEDRDFENDFIRECLKDLKRTGITFVFNHKQFELLKERINCEIYDNDGYAIYVRKI